MSWENILKDDVICPRCGGAGYYQSNREREENLRPEDKCYRCGGKGRVKSIHPRDSRYDRKSGKPPYKTGD